MAATPPLSELEPLLASLNELKPPGANKSKIAAITAICVKNIQAEQSIVQSFYRALKKAPSTHKLGALYVIDSVIRQWTERAKKAGQDLKVEGRGEPGTYPAALKRISELMPALLDHSVKVIPAEQKPKLENLVDIWDRGNFFPTKVIAEFKTKLRDAPRPTAQVVGDAAVMHGQRPSEKFKCAIPTRPVHTPVGWPPQYLFDQGFLMGKGNAQSTNGAGNRQNGLASPTVIQQLAQQTTQPSAPSADVHSILAALANAAPKPGAAAPLPPPPPSQPAGAPPAPASGLPPNLAALFGQTALPQPTPQATHSVAPPFGAPSHQMSQFNPAAFQASQGFAGFPPQPPPSIPPQFAQAPPPQQSAPPQMDLLGPLRSILPQNILNDREKLMQALNLLQELQSGGLPMDQWAPVIQAFSEQASNQPAAGPVPGYGGGGFGGYNNNNNNNNNSSQINQNNDNNNDRARGRSRSPDRGGRGRGSPVYGNYDEAAGRRQGDENGRGGRERARYRQRSPVRNSPAPVTANGTAMNGNPMQPKVILIDNSLPHNSIKVLSRTLFVGGANGSQHEIQSLFERFGKVQTCIANREKRHAFVKMTTRHYALNAKAGMEASQASNDREILGIARQTKWGVGFGPRECCDYGKGESIIPIQKLTEADVKWLLSAEFGGTGGKQLEGGMVLEEPDIEIGAGVSSKAMSRRVVPDGGPPKRTREDRERERGGRRGERDRGRGRHGDREDAQMGGMPMEAYGYARPEPVAVATPPAVPGFGFILPGN